MPSLWNVDNNADAIEKRDETGTILTSFASPNADPRGLGYDKTQSQFTLVNGDGNSIIYEVDETGSFNQLFSVSAAYFGAGVDATNSIWLTDSVADDLIEYDRTGTVQTCFATPSDFPRGIAEDSSTCLWTVIRSDETIKRVDRTGSLISNFSTPKTGPTGLGIESSESLWHGDKGVNSIYNLDWSGTVLSQFAGSNVFGVATEDEPIGVTTGGGTVTDTAVKDSQAFSPFQSTEVSEGAVSAIKEAFGFGTGKAQPAKVWFDTTEQWDSAKNFNTAHASDVVSLQTGESSGYIIPSQQNWEG